MVLTDYAKQQLSGASRSAIAAAMRQLPMVGSESPEWLPSGHRYDAPDISGILRRDTEASVIDGRALAQRMAASLPSHVLDGWSLFGRAVHCLIRGDTRTAVHLGYYAELRAVLAIVASEGIAIFDRQHFVVDADGTAHRLCSAEGVPTDRGTHTMIWPVYDWWIQQPPALELMQRVIQPAGKTIQEWFDVPERDALYIASSAQQWLNDWGLDLKRMNADRGARNASSYGPSALHRWQTIERFESVRIAADLWRMFDPTLSSRFERIDRLLLRRIFLRGFESRTTRRPGSKNWNIEINREAERFLDDREDNHLVQLNREYWHQFLVELEENEATTVLTYASKSSDADAVHYPVEMLSRAALLLRIASGSCGFLLVQAGSDWESLMFWLDDIGTRRGFWVPGQHPEIATELWADIVEALDDIEEGLIDDRNGLTELEECERIAMWGFGL